MGNDVSAELNALSYAIIGVAMRVHTELGPGLREGIYEQVLASRLTEAGHRVVSQADIHIRIGSQHFDRALRVDLIVDDLLLVEVKCTNAIADAHIRQLASYLRFTKLELGLILNFAAPSLRHGIRRVITTQ